MPVLNKVKFLWLLVSLVLALGLVVTACGGDDEEPAPTRPPAPTAAPTTAATSAPTATRPAATAVPAPTATPVPPTPTPAPQFKRGGILKSRIEFTPSSAPHWNLLQGPINAAYPLYQPVLSTLVQLNMTNLNIDPDLAQSWTIGADGKTLTFRIRQGVTWHDGSPLTAADIKYNWDVMIKDSLGFTSHFKALLSAAQNTRVVDASTFEITLKQPRNSFFRTMTHAVMFNYSPRVSVQELQAGKIVGTNAYRWAGLEKDRKVELRAYPGYWERGADGRPLPYFDGIDWFVITDSTAHIAAFRTGQIDAFDHINATALVGQIDTIKRDIPGLVSGAGYDSWRMLLLKNRGALVNPSVRKAIQIGLDRGSFVQAGMGGAGLPSGYASTPGDVLGNWAPTMAEQQRLPGMNPATKQQDIAEAERLLSTAGFTAASPLKITMYVVSGGVFATEAEAAATLLNRIRGLSLAVATEPSAVHNQRLILGGDFDIIYRPFAQAIDDPSQTIGLFWTTGASRNYGGWSDAQIDAMYTEQESTTDEARRKRIVADLQTRLYDSAYYVVLAWAATPWIRKPEMRNMPLGGSFVNRGRYDKTWIDK